jgi:hypothetical protein
MLHGSVCYLATEVVIASRQFTALVWLDLALVRKLSGHPSMRARLEVFSESRGLHAGELHV